MKRLFLMRHAKSDWAGSGVVDFERPLSRRGRRAAPAMGRYMRRQKLIPDLALCSTARRAIETWEGLASQLKTSVPLMSSKRLYLAAPGEILKQIQGLTEDINSVLIIGHNPGLHSLALHLTGRGDADSRTRLASKYPTGAVAILDFPVTYWGDLAAGEGELSCFVAPRDVD
ncbi:MAG: phosphohistidine phosphatase [Rhodospirillaceae bacterium]|jgi:phosphohistidine phosphatase|nr:phosphohistidine phosphatase [Rhodospirillaceae bacterium]